MTKSYKYSFIIIFYSIIFSQEAWFEGNLKGVENIDLKLNVKGFDDQIWEKKLFSFIQLRFLEHGLKVEEKPMPQLVLDIHLIDSRVEKVSSYMVSFSLCGYSISEHSYYESLAVSSIPKNLMISKIFSHEIMGQSTSNNLYKDVEKSVQKLISMFIDQWYSDNPIKQF